MVTKSVVIGAAVVVLAALFVIGAMAGYPNGSQSGSKTIPNSSSASSGSPSTTSTAFALPSSCHSVNGLPDPGCTPGATNPDVTQANIQSTICVSGYTTTIRPPTSYTNPLKIQSIKLYGYSDTNVSDYEEDHLIPLEVGGNPTSVANLWAEPHYGQYTSLNKDQLENSLHSMVCSGQMALADAQQAFSTNWAQAWLASGGAPSSSSSTTVQTSSSGLVTATISYAIDPIVRGNTQMITITLTSVTGPLVGHSLAVHVTYASLQTTKDLTCTTSTSGSCAVPLLVGGSSYPGTFMVSVVDRASGATFSSSFQVTTA